MADTHVLKVLLFLAVFPNAVFANCLERAIDIAERSCIKAFEAMPTGVINLKVLKIGAKSYGNLIECIRGEKAAAKEVLECEKTITEVKTSSIFKLCIGQACSSGTISYGCDSKKNEQNLMGQYCIAALGAGSKVISVNRTTKPGGPCGYVFHDFRCEKTIVR